MINLATRSLVLQILAYMRLLAFNR